MQDSHYFIGIKAPAAIYNQANTYKEIYSLKDHYKVIPEKEDYHITLQFLGAVPDRLRRDITKSLEDIASRYSPFSLQSGGLDTFGPADHPRVVYMNVEQSEQLCSLQKEINHEISALFNRPPAHRFTPHITIAKKKKSDVPLTFSREKGNFIDIPVASFSLFAIHPASSPKYEIVCSYPLQ